MSRHIRKMRSVTSRDVAQTAELIVSKLERRGIPDDAVRNLGVEIIHRQYMTQQVKPKHRLTTAKCS